MSTVETIEGIRLKPIPAGSFMMGHVYEHDPALPENVNRYYADEQPVHKMKVNAFLMGETPVTQAQYEAITGENLSIFKGDDLPVTNVSAEEIEQFCNKLSESAGLESCYDGRTFNPTKNGYRMPNEAEWEYACRAGTTTLFYTGNTEADLARAGWYLGNSGGTIHPVGQKEPNAWGLFDMHGNVFEFCNEKWNPELIYGKYLIDGEAKQDTSLYCYIQYCITRGGDWYSEPCHCRSALRSCFCDWSGQRGYHNGFRIARSMG